MYQEFLWRFANGVMKYLSQIAAVDAATGSHIFDREKEVVKKQLEMLLAGGRLCRARSSGKQPFLRW